jgi:hypothetical protein
VWDPTAWGDLDRVMAEHALIRAEKRQADDKFFEVRACLHVDLDVGLGPLSSMKTRLDDRSRASTHAAGPPTAAADE